MNLNILLLFCKNMSIIKEKIKGLEEVKTKLSVEYEI